MENAGVQKKQTGESPSVARALWDPFGFMQEMFGWGRSGEGPLFEVKETDDTYICKVKVNLTLPDQADVAHAKAELENGELTLVVPKAAAAMLATQPPPRTTTSAPESHSQPQTATASPEPESPPRRTRRANGTGKDGGSATRGPQRGSRARARRGR
jgi:hypothetical protein